MLNNQVSTNCCFKMKKIRVVYSDTIQTNVKCVMFINKHCFNKSIRLLINNIKRHVYRYVILYIKKNINYQLICLKKLGNNIIYLL